MMGLFLPSLLGIAVPGGDFSEKTKKAMKDPTTEARDFVSAPPPKKGDPTEVNI